MCIRLREEKPIGSRSASQSTHPLSQLLALWRTLEQHGLQFEQECVDRRLRQTQEIEDRSDDHLLRGLWELGGKKAV